MRTCQKVAIGDKGQRYEVRAQDKAESQEFVVGWTEEKNGGGLVEMVNRHPSWHSPRVVDRWNP
jgi:hypothetical protein